MRIEPSKLKKYYIYSFNELYKLIDNRLKTIQVPPPPGRKRNPLIELKNTLLAKIATTYNIIDREYEKIIEALETTEKMHPFYQELFKIHVGYKPGELVKKMKITRRNLRRIYLDTRNNIKTSLLMRETTTKFKAGLGRLLSFYKRNNKLILKIKEAVKELSKLPDITGELVVIISGMPQVGKSTLIRSLTRAKPEVANYPFTTKTIIAGHIPVEPYGRIVLIDTPGLLDRPLEEKNPIELKAVYALKLLADKALYLFDVSRISYYDYKNQLNVYRDIEKLLGSEKIYPVIHKIDETPKDKLVEYSRRIEEDTGKKPILISALKKTGLEELRRILMDWFWEKTQHHE